MEHWVNLFFWVFDITIIRIIEQLHYFILFSINDKIWVLLNKLKSLLLWVEYHFFWNITCDLAFNQNVKMLKRISVGIYTFVFLNLLKLQMLKAIFCLLYSFSQFIKFSSIFLLKSLLGCTSRRKLKFHLFFLYLLTPKLFILILEISLQVNALHKQELLHQSCVF